MTIRKSIICAITLFAMLVIFSSPYGYCADVAKIGTVDFQKIFENSAAGKAAKSQLNQEGQRMNADLEKIQEEIKNLQGTIEKDSNSGVMTKVAIDDKRWELSRKVEEVKALKKRYDRKIHKLQVELINSVRKNVLKIIEAYGKKEGFLIIIEDMGVVYAPQSIAITDKIIQLYNADYAKKSKKK